MNTSGADQQRALEGGDLPPLEQVRDDVWALAQPMPGGHLAYSLSYLLRGADGGVHVVDPGTDSDGNWDRLCAALRSIAPGEDVTGITGTHLHPDHVGMAARLRDATGAPLSMHAVERAALERHATRAAVLGSPSEEPVQLADWGVPEGRRRELAQHLDRSPDGLALAVDHDLVDGDVLPIAGFRLEVMATPGHTAGHLCLRDDERRIFLTGDHVLPTVFAGLGLGGPTTSNPLADYLASIERITRYGDHEALPGHGYRFTGLGGRARECAEHHLERARDVARILAEEDGSTVWDIASRLTWTAGWDGLHGFQLLSALSQTAMHRDHVLAGGRI